MKLMMLWWVFQFLPKLCPHKTEWIVDIGDEDQIRTACTLCETVWW